MTSKSAPTPIFRISLTNAAILSTLYLVVAVLVELARRYSSARWAERISLAFEVFPARTLDLLGLFEPLRGAWLAGHLSDGGVRVLYGATTVGVIFSLGMVVGVVMWLLINLSPRRGGPGTGSED